MQDPLPVVVLAWPGVSAYEAVGALAAFHAAGLPAEIASAEALVHAREGARLVPHRLGYDLVPQAPALVLPDGDPAPAVDAALARALRARRGQWLLASGEGGLRVAAGAGLLEGRRIARLPGLPPLPGVEETPARLVGDGRVLTCLGGDGLVDLALHYVARASGSDAAARAAARLGREHHPFVLGASQS